MPANDIAIRSSNNGGIEFTSNHGDTPLSANNNDEANIQSTPVLPSQSSIASWHWSLGRRLLPSSGGGGGTRSATSSGIATTTAVLMFLSLAIAAVAMMVFSKGPSKQNNSNPLRYDTTDPLDTATVRVDDLSAISQQPAPSSGNEPPSTSKYDDHSTLPPREMAIAFGGNSMLYFNDCPRLVQQMLEATSSTSAAAGTTTSTGSSRGRRIVVHQDSCLRGGATLTSLWKHGNGMATKFATPPAIVSLPAGKVMSHYQKQCLIPKCNDNKEQGDDDDNANDEADDEESGCKSLVYYNIGSPTIPQMIKSHSVWDAVILNDYTQGPARPQSRAESIHTLQTKYTPLLVPSARLVILIQTPAYRARNLKGSDDLGNFESFSDLLASGVHAYAETLRGNDYFGSDSKVRVAPVGEAYRYLYRHNRELWNALYSWDDFHPSPHGTWLQACVIYLVLLNSAATDKNDSDTPKLPPMYNASWWDQSRVMQPTDEDPLPRPTMAEAAELRRIACLIVLGQQTNNESEDAKICRTI